MNTDTVVNSRTFCVGDIHGCYKALVQCLERCGFNYSNDILISLGDIVDGWHESYECVEELLKINNHINIRGNHDDWFLTWIETQMHPCGWNHGGFKTLKSYGTKCLGNSWENFKIYYKMSGAISNLSPFDLPKSHIDFFKHQINYYIDDKNRLFVHGGFDRSFSIKDQTPYIYYWDRELWEEAMSYEATIRGNESNKKIKNKFKTKDNFSEIFIGHSSTINWNKDTPMRAVNIWNLDTGAGYKGKLTIMNVDTHEFWQSDPVQRLYPNHVGR